MPAPEEVKPPARVTRREEVKLRPLDERKAAAFSDVLELLMPLSPKDRANVLRAACVFFEVEP